MRDYVPTPKIIKDVAQLVSEHESLLHGYPDKTWIFRGEGFRESDEETWTLQPSLERAVQRFEPLTRAPELEYWILREFQRRHHHYESATPELWNTVEWLALMQHHGAPTRLLDWTYSPFVASFFALQEATGKRKALVWCCNANWLREKALKMLRDGGVQLPAIEDPFRQDGTENTASYFDRIFCIQNENPPKPKATVVYPINSFRLNQRLTIQQGMFLVPSDVSLPFHTNLTLMDPGTEGFRLWILEKGENMADHRNMLRQLARMNLSEAVLYPGLDGFSRSLKLNWRLIGR